MNENNNFDYVLKVDEDDEKCKYKIKFKTNDKDVYFKVKYFIKDYLDKIAKDNDGVKNE